MLAILGGPGASPYGTETTGALARGLASAGVTIVTGLSGELARAAHRGAAHGRGGSLAVAGDGLERIRPAGAATLAQEVAHGGCVVSELPARASGRGWGSVAAERTVVELASVVVLVEGDVEAHATDLARAAFRQGVTVGVVPGPVTSRLSTGPHALLMERARLIRDAGDALDLLYEGAPGPTPTAADPAGPAVGRRLREILERVGAGEDTAERLSRGAADGGAVVAALGELEALGLLRRLPGGRYVAREPARRAPEIG
jgi:DNA processing protein